MQRQNLGGFPPTHPGAVLREDVLPALKAEHITKTMIADELGITRAAFDNVLNEKSAVSPAMAVKLGALLGNGPDLWINMQAQYDLHHAAATVDVSGIRSVKQMRRIAPRRSPPLAMAARKRRA